MGLSVTAPTPTAWTWSIEIGFFAGVEASAVGGAAPYTYAWSLVTGGDAILASPTSQTLFVTSQDGSTSTVQCEVTDAAMNTALSNIVTLEL